MQPWERRLSDLGHLLRNCQATYFDPDPFRRNTNQFLQTARTVTFLIQKQKETIPNYAGWYEDNVHRPWADDRVMKWARDSRNTIEKEGDLDLNSSLTVTLIFSYIDDQDISVPCSRNELVAANIKRLIRFARKRLPTGVSTDAVIRIERRWVGNSLPDWELLHALLYVYARIHTCCSNLASHLSATLDPSIRHSTDFDDVATDARRIRYLTLDDLQTGTLKARRMHADPKFEPPPALQAVLAEIPGKPTNLAENLAFYSRMARATFDHFGNHMPMLWLFDDQYKPIDFISGLFSDQTSKYIFWRHVADRILYLKATSLIWISEAWIRDIRGYAYKRMKDLPIIGETLHVIALDKDDKSQITTWNIKRGPSGPPTLELVSEETENSEPATFNYLIPARKAFAKLKGGRPNVAKT